MQKNTARPAAIGLTMVCGLARMAQRLNFAPVGAMSLFAGARLRGWQAYALPIALMAVTDPLLGGYSFATPFVYASFLINVWIGTRLRRTERPLWILAASLIGSLQFYVLADIGSWLDPHGMYPHTLSGLAACLAAAVPFLRNTAIADAVYTGVLFGAHAVLSRTVVRTERVAAAA